MTDINIQDLDSSHVPFFTRYLEEQNVQDLSAAELNAISGGLLATLDLPEDPAERERILKERERIFNEQKKKLTGAFNFGLGIDALAV